jgi:hypothetical protein
MDSVTQDHLNTKAEELLLFKAKPSLSMVEEIMVLDVNDLETITDDVLSKYVIVLSQYLIFFNSQMNRSRVMHKIYSRDFGRALSAALIGVQGKTVAERTAKVVSENTKLAQLEGKVHHYENEVDLGKNHDDQVTTLINALKRELTRRENENQIIRRERRS